MDLAMVVLLSCMLIHTLALTAAGLAAFWTWIDLPLVSAVILSQPNTNLEIYSMV